MQNAEPAGVWRILSVLMVLALKVQANEFDFGNQLYDQGKFTEAKQAYERQVESGPLSANVFYNLGNTDYRLGSAGRAMLNYERALALNPRHPEAQANLRFLRGQAAAKLPPVSWMEEILASQSGSFWTIVAVAAGWVMLFALVCIVTSRRTKSGLWLFGLTSAAVFAVALLALRNSARHQALAIITAGQIEARLAPASSAGVAEALPAGSRVRVLSERGEWIYCELPGTGRGWIPHDALERVRPVRS
jgi:tetratricopeptide (TPR) repeat protein